MSQSLTRAELEAYDPHNPANGRLHGEVDYLCPFCGDAKPKDAAHRSLSLNLDSGLWHCFRCEAKGRLREKWEDKRQEKPFDRRSRAQVALKRAFSLPMTAEPSVSVPLAKSTGGQSAHWRAALLSLQPLENTPGALYLQQRALPLEVCLAARVKFSADWPGQEYYIQREREAQEVEATRSPGAAEQGRGEQGGAGHELGQSSLSSSQQPLFRPRFSARPAVVFPIYDDQGHLVAAQGRYLKPGPNQPKMLTVGDKKRGLFFTAGFWQQVQAGAPVSLVEAPIDALSLAACGYPALALCGKSGVPDWLRIRLAFRTVALAFDADEAGDEAALKLKPELVSLGVKVKRLCPEGFKDWNQGLEEQGTKYLTDWLDSVLF